MAVSGPSRGHGWTLRVRVITKNGLDFVLKCSGDPSSGASDPRFNKFTRLFNIYSELSRRDGGIENARAISLGFFFGNAPGITPPNPEIIQGNQTHLHNFATTKISNLQISNQINKIQQMSLNKSATF